jgi:hypothetical protein
MVRSTSLNELLPFARSTLRSSITKWELEMKTVVEIVIANWIKSIANGDRAHLDEIAKRIQGAIIKGKEIADMVVEASIWAAKRADMDHYRAALLRLYRQRHGWKTADLPRLNTYRLNRAASKRVASLKKSSRLGRGSTMAYQPLVKQLAEVGRYFAALHDPNTPGHERLRMLKRHKSWWPQFIEMTYRGEYDQLKRLGVLAPSEEAERAVAKAFCVSTSIVRRNCIMVRRDPSSRNALSDSITVAEFGAWKLSGRLPEPATVAVAQ